MTDTDQNRLEQDRLHDLQGEARIPGYVGGYMAASSLVVSLLAYFGIDLFGNAAYIEGSALDLAFSVAFCVIMAGIAFWAWTGARAGAIAVLLLLALEVWSRVELVLAGGSFGVPILLGVMIFFAVKGTLASFQYQAARKRLARPAAVQPA